MSTAKRMYACVANPAALDIDHATVRAALDPAAPVNPTVSSGQITAWNRLPVGFRFEHPA